MNCAAQASSPSATGSQATILGQRLGGALGDALGGEHVLFGERCRRDQVGRVVVEAERLFFGAEAVRRGWWCRRAGRGPCCCTRTRVMRRMGAEPGSSRPMHGEGGGRSPSLVPLSGPPPPPAGAGTAVWANNTGSGTTARARARFRSSASSRVEDQGRGPHSQKCTDLPDAADSAKQEKYRETGFLPRGGHYLVNARRTKNLGRFFFKQVVSQVSSQARARTAAVIVGGPVATLRAVRIDRDRGHALGQGERFDDTGGDERPAARRGDDAHHVRRCRRCLANRRR